MPIYRNREHIRTADSTAEDFEVVTGAKTFDFYPREMLVIGAGDVEGVAASGRTLSAFPVVVGMMLHTAFTSLTANTTATLLCKY